MMGAFAAARTRRHGRRLQYGRISRIYGRHGSAGEKEVAAAPAPFPFARRSLCCPHPPPAACPPTPRRRRLSTITATSLTAARAAPAVAPPDTCPICGGASIRRAPLLDRLKELGIPAVGGGFKTRKSGEEYLKCHGCGAEFVPINRDIKTIMNGLMVQKNVPDLIEYYYKRRIKVSDLLTRHRTAIIRRVNVKRSMLGVSASQKELIICFMYRGVRTFGTFVRKADPKRGAHYVFTELSME